MIEITKLKNLKILYLDSNQIQPLPSGLFELEALEMIDLACNQLRTLPEEIAKLKN